MNTLKYWEKNDIRILYPGKLCIKNEGKVKTLLNIEKLKEFMTSKPALEND